MNFKKLLCVKNIFLWIAGMLSIVLAIYFMAYTWTIKLTFLHDGKDIINSYNVNALALAFGQPIALESEALVTGQSLILSGNILYFVSCMIFLFVGLAAIGMSFLMKKFKGKTFLFILIIILFIVGLVFFLIGSAPAFNQFYDGHSGPEGAGNFDKETADKFMALALNDGYTLISFTRSPELWLANSPVMWLLGMAIVAAYFPGMIIPLPREKAAPVQEQPVESKEEAPIEKNK